MDQRSAEPALLGIDRLTDALELSRLAGWNQTIEDWRRLLVLAPRDCFAIEADGRIVATTTLLCYGTQIAWIGMVLTHPGYRGRGFARQLVQHAVDRALQLGVQTVKLDATEAGRTLYDRIGFRAEQAVERWASHGEIGTPEVRGTFCSELDFAACGYHRAELLGSLGATPSPANAEAYLLARPGSLQAYLGPFVASNPAAAVQCIDRVLEALPGVGWFWDLLPSNRDAVALASARGFHPVRSLTRMVLGRELRGRDDQIYGIAGFELG